MPFPFAIDNHELLIWALNIVKALLIVVLGVLIGRFVRGWLLRLGTRRTMNLNVISLLGNLIQVATVVFSLVLILPTFGVDWTALLTLVGTVGLALSLAAQDLLRNFIAGVYILIEQPFKIGDKVRVETGAGVTGVVQSIELRVTNLRTDTGEQVVVPNNLIFSNVVINQSAYNLQRHAVDITVKEGDLSEVNTLISDTLRQIEGVSKIPAPSTTVETLTANQIKLRVIFWTQPSNLMVLPQALLALRDALPQAQIEVGGPSA